MFIKMSRISGDLEILYAWHDFWLNSPTKRVSCNEREVCGTHRQPETLKRIENANVVSLCDRGAGVKE